FEALLKFCVTIALTAKLASLFLNNLYPSVRQICDFAYRVACDIRRKYTRSVHGVPAKRPRLMGQTEKSSSVFIFA
ncbi:MAG: hypothetical protein NC303_06585, partial [Firmicutes bacterium]|nr:hypothetical protein [Bacillota bacterium]